MLRAAGKKTKQNKGAALIEYGIIVSLIGIVSIGTVSALGEQIKSIYGGAASAIAMGNAIASNGANGIDPCGEVSQGGNCDVDNTTYIGDSASGRLYVEFRDMGFGVWKGEGGMTIPNSSTSTGLQNTKALLQHGIDNGYTYPLAQACSDMGNGWFMPSQDEFIMMRQYMVDQGIDIVSIYGTYHYGTSSTDASGTNYIAKRFSDNATVMRSATGITSLICMRTYEAP
jgi:Flp pilus assembly pilin Flp